MRIVSTATIIPLDGEPPASQEDAIQTSGKIAATEPTEIIRAFRRIRPINGRWVILLWGSFSALGAKAHNFQMRKSATNLWAIGLDSLETMGTDRRTSRTRSLRVWLMFLVSSLTPCGMVQAQTAPTGVSPISEGSRIDRLEQMVRSLAEENRRLSGEVRELKEQLSVRVPTMPSPTPPPASPPAAEAGEQPSPGPMAAPLSVAPPEPPSAPQARFDKLFDNYKVGYDGGFAIVPENIDETPFSMKVNSQDVFRYTGFARGPSYWINTAGERIPITNNNNFSIPRGRLIFSGKALLPKLSYLLNIDYNTVTSNPIGFRAYQLSYQFNRTIEIHVGQGKVPGSREWLESAFAALEGPDRSMATTFFRPSLSQGVWITGEPLDAVYYHAMVSNGFNTLNLRPTYLNQRYCFSGSLWWEPWADFGRGYSDLQQHEEAAIRLGGSYTYALGRGSQTATDAVENSPVRLSDGTLITTPGALAPGVTLQTYDISLAAVDASYKYRGLGLSTELYFQDLLNLRGNGPLPIRSTSAFGGFLQGGYFIVPRRAELYARTSYVTGHFGGGSEVAGGFNWFFLEGKDNLRFTFDAAWLDHSPAGQNRTGYDAGQTGILIRTQITATY